MMAKKSSKKKVAGKGKKKAAKEPTLQKQLKEARRIAREMVESYNQASRDAESQRQLCGVLSDQLQESEEGKEALEKQLGTANRQIKVLEARVEREESWKEEAMKEERKLRQQYHGDLVDIASKLAGLSSHVLEELSDSLNES